MALKSVVPDEWVRGFCSEQLCPMSSFQLAGARVRRAHRSFWKAPNDWKICFLVENRRWSWSLSQRAPGGQTVWSSAVQRRELRRRLRILLAEVGFEPVNWKLVLLATDL